jgi:serine phosphatase RsbU (regulator of sigma subunit)
VNSVVRCIELGAVDYLLKPFNPVLLKARLGATLEKKKLRDQIDAHLERLEAELDAARRLQMAMVPHTVPAASAQFPIDLCATMEPAREVGGDLYDCFFADERVLCLLVGDVSEKGAPAAMFMARTRSLVRMAVNLRGELVPGAVPSPASIAATVNRELCQNNDERMFVSLVLGFLDTASGAMSYMNAGHPLPIIVAGSGQLSELKSEPEVPLGVKPDAQYHDRDVKLGPADMLFVYSDGVSEATNAAGEFFGLERLVSALVGAQNLAPADLIAAVKTKMDRFAGSAPKADDVTMLALRWSPAD